MADRRDYFFGQQVQEDELDQGFDGLERADHDQYSDLALIGIASGGLVAQHSATPDLTVDVPALVAYDQQGRRIQVPTTQTVNLAVDSNSVSTTVATPGNTKIVSVFARFKRVQSDQRTDENAVTVYFVQDEGFEFVVVQGAEANPGTPPALLTDGILLADVTRTFGQTQILTANIALAARRQDMFVASAGALAVRQGTPLGSDQAILTHLNNHVTGVANKHPASAIDYAGSSPSQYADGSTLAAQSVEAALDAVVAAVGNLAAAQSGARKLGVEQYTVGSITIVASTLLSVLQQLTDSSNIYLPSLVDWADATNIGTGDVHSRISNLIAQLASTASSDGAGRLGAKATNGFSAGTIRSQLDELAPAAAGTAFSAAKTFNGAAGDTNPAFKTTATPTNRKVLWEITLAGSVKLRIYSRAQTSNYLRGLEITANAAWNGSNWSADSTSVPAYMFALFMGPALSVWNGDDTTSQLLRKGTTSSTWAENAWDSPGLEFAAGNPSATATTFDKNLLTSASIIKAWGVISTDGAGNVSIDEGLGLASVTLSSGDITVTMRNAMASGNYAPMVQPLVTGVVSSKPIITSTAAFKIRALDASAVQINLSAVVAAFSVHVCGKQS
jgi:hypothetical protein